MNLLGGLVGEEGTDGSGGAVADGHRGGGAAECIGCGLWVGDGEYKGSSYDDGGGDGGGGWWGSHLKGS